jgi:hypothetical protein
VVAAGGGRRDTFKISFSEIGNFRTLIHLYSHSLFLLSRNTKFQGRGPFSFMEGGHFTKNRQKSSSFIRVQMYPPRRPRWRGEGQGPIARVRALGRSHVRGYDGRLDKKSSRDECNNDRNARCDRLQQCSRCGRHTRGPQGKGGEREAKTRSHCEVRSPAVVLPFPLPLSPLPPGPVC